MNKKLLIHKENIFPAKILFFIGFVTGVILPNMIYKMKWRQDTASALYLLGIYSGEESTEYLWKVIRMRGGLFLLAVGSGLTIFGIPVAVGGMLLTGMYIAMLLTMSIIQFGLHGGLVGAGILFPQWIIYLPCICAVCGIIYESSLRIWKSKSFLPGQVTEYTIKILICAICFAAGIALEVYGNPVITEVLIRNLKIF